MKRHMEHPRMSVTSVNDPSLAASQRKQKWHACDACHANKSRCTGGPQCMLCTRRGIPCTFKSSGEASDVPEVSNAEDAPPVASNQEITTNTSNQGLGNMAAGVAEFLRLCNIRTASAASTSAVSSVPEEQAPPVELTASCSMETLHRLVLASSTKPDQTLERTMAASPDFQEWVLKCSRAYFEHHHPRWPILHAPTFDEESDPLPLVAGVLIIGCWLEGDLDSQPWVLKTHQVLANHLFEKLISLRHDLRENAWPMDLFQAVLLTIIFGVLINVDDMSSKANLLCSLLVPIVRGTGMFNIEACAHQQRTHFPGTFLPFVTVTDQKWKRFVISLLIIDTYLSATHHQPPFLRMEEVEISLPMTFGLWNAHPIKLFFQRWHEEPKERGTCRITDATAHSPRHLRSCTFLLEDVYLGLCGSQERVWKYTLHHQMAPATSAHNLVDNVTGASERDATAAHLNAWAAELDMCAALCAEQGISSLFDRSLPLRAYLGGSNSSDMMRWKLSPLQIARTLRYECVLLYQLLTLRLFGDISLLDLGNSTPAADQAPALPEPSWRLQGWAMSPDGRRALLHAVSVLIMVGESMAEGLSYAQRASGGLIERVTIDTGIRIAEAWIANNANGCICGTGMDSTQYDANTPLSVLQNDPNLQSWIATGGAAMLNGLSICQCTLSEWLMQWRSSYTLLQRGYQSLQQ
ncbi:hypothetical protein BX600DRAFT_439164 [Xylariales sp. PMI_506]|nr:hypothetical protein BX600DRAFT_439164 [Xylariales sp. PMI_506]